MSIACRGKTEGASVIKTVNALSNLLRAVVSVAVLVALAAGGWWAYRAYHADRLQAEQLQAQEAKINELTGELAASHQQIGRLESEVEAKQKEIQRLDTAMRLLKVDRRVAQIDVLSQRGSAENGDLVSHFSFTELDEQQNPIEEPRVFSVNGDVIYVDAWVVKFDDEFVETGDPLRSTSVCLFRRVFGEMQSPSSGFPLDPVGSRPAAYRNGSKLSEFEKEIWSKFWEYANDRDKARAAGVRAAHGEAPYLKLVPGKRYKLELRASGGLTVIPEDLPRAAKPARVAETL